MQATVTAQTNFRVTNEVSFADTGSALAPTAGPTVSKRYQFVPTSHIIEGLKERNWVAVSAEQCRSKKPENQGYQKHMIKFRQADQILARGEYTSELIWVNSHDGGSVGIMMLGLFVALCGNGIMVGQETFGAIRFRHSGIDANEVFSAAMKVADYVPELNKSVGLMKNRILESGEMGRLLAHSLALRYPEISKAPIRPEMLNKARRSGDVGWDLWTTFNRIQENLIRGGLTDGIRSEKGRLRGMRSIRGIDAKVSVNRGVWDLATVLAQGRELPVIELAE